MTMERRAVAFFMQKTIASPTRQFRFPLDSPPATFSNVLRPLWAYLSHFFIGHIGLSSFCLIGRMVKPKLRCHNPRYPIDALDQ